MSISKTVRNVSLASLILMIGGFVSCQIGDRNWAIEVQESEREMAASGFYFSDGHTEADIWQIVGTVILFAGISVAIAAFMLWRQDSQG